MYLVLRVDGDRVISVTGVTSELSWGHPFTLEKTLMKMPPEIFAGHRVHVLALRHPQATPGVAYYALDNAPRVG
jgi:hypothetical protein